MNPTCCTHLAMQSRLAYARAFILILLSVAFLHACGGGGGGGGSVVTASSTQSELPARVQFEVAIPGATAWEWSFGDGGTSTEQAPYHTYDSAGSFNVSVRVTTPDGDQLIELSNFIEIVEPRPVSATPPQGTAPLTVSFDSMTLGAESWAWDFGDETASTLGAPDHTYTLPGTYEVEVMCQRDSDSIVKNVTIFVTAPPDPSGVAGTFAAMGIGEAPCFEEGLFQPIQRWTIQPGSPGTLVVEGIPVGDNITANDWDGPLENLTFVGEIGNGVLDVAPEDGRPGYIRGTFGVLSEPGFGGVAFAQVRFSLNGEWREECPGVENQATFYFLPLVDEG